MNKILFLIHKKKYVEKLKDSKLLRGNYLIVGLNEEVCIELEKAHIPYKKLSDYLNPQINLKKKSIEWIKKWPNQIAVDKKRIKEYFTYQNVPLWWMVEFWLYQASTFYDPLENVIIYLDKINSIVKKEKPIKILFDDDGTSKAEVIECICKSLKIKYNLINKNKAIRVKRATINRLKPRSIFYYKLFRNFLRKYLYSLMKIILQRRKERRKENLLLISENDWGETRDPQTGKKEIDDLRFSNIIKSIDKKRKYNAIVVDNPIGKDLRIKHYTSRFNRFATYNPFEYYVSFNAFLRSIVNKNKTNSKWKKIRRNEGLYFYENINLKQILKPRLDFLFSYYILETFMFFECAKKFIRKEKPKAMFVSSEFNPPQKVDIALGRLHNIKSVAVQHGAIGYCSEFVFKKEDVSNQFKVTAPYIPLPNINAVYGDYYKQFLIKCSNYKKEWIKSIGNTRYDFIPIMDKIYSKEKLCKRLGLNPKKKIILLTMVPYFDQEEKVLFLRNILSAVKKFDAQLIIKKHPNEITKNIHRKLCDQVGLENVVIVDKEEVFELIYCSDLMITFNSTTIIDTLAVGRPVIMMDVTKKDPYCKDFLKTKAMLYVWDEKGAYKALNSILNNKGVRNKLEMNRKRFIKEYTYKIDGKASERAVNLIK